MGCGSSTNQAVRENEPVQRTDNRAAEVNNSQQQQQQQTKAATKSGPDGNKFVEDTVKKHNELRAMHGAPPMKSAQDLTDYAQKWADNLAKKDTMKHSDVTLPSGERIGENLYCCWSSDPNAGVSADDAVQSWYDEIKDYDFNNGTFSMETGHFTQVVWKGSLEVGVAFAQAKGGMWYVVANYRPPGNYQGEFSNNVLPKQ